ncbi:aldo-keto reductase family 1 member A1-like isoform 1-T4 [Trichechus inunguis]
MEHRVAGWADRAGAWHLCPHSGGCPTLRQGDNPFPKNADGTIRYDSTHYKETWKALEAQVAKGLVRALGLSNFNSRQIDDVLSVASVRPAVLQVECHPYLAQKELIAHCHAHGLEVTAYSPLGSSDHAWGDPDEPVLLEDPMVLAQVEKYGRSPAQVLLRGSRSSEKAAWRMKQCLGGLTTLPHLPQSPAFGGRSSGKWSPSPNPSEHPGV